MESRNSDSVFVKSLGQEILHVTPVFLFYGNHTEKILKARDEILEIYLPRDNRHENLTEYYPTKDPTVPMAPRLDEIAGDLEMMSFLPEAVKFVIFNNPGELFAPKRRGRSRANKPRGEPGGPSPGEKIAAWVRGSLPATGHKLILLAVEDESTGREVDEKSPIYRAVQEIGYLKRFRTVHTFKIEDALIARDITPLILNIRELWGSGGGDLKVYHCVLRCLRFLMQSNLDREPSISGNVAMRELIQPRNRQFCLKLAHERVRDKYRLPVYRTLHLIEAYHSLLEAYQAMRPGQDARFVPDARELMESLLVRLLRSAPPVR